jgi:RNA polymerase sigma-54 factor
MNGGSNRPRMGHHLEQRLVQKQKLVMTQQMRHAIELLQMSHAELEQKVEDELVANPALELANEEPEAESKPSGESASAGDSSGSASDVDFTFGPSGTSEEEAVLIQADPSKTDTNDTGHFSDVDVNWDDYYGDSESRVYTPREPDEEEHSYEEYVARRETLYEYLKHQLHVTPLDRESLRIGEYLIGSIDDDGYLREPIEDLAAQLKCSVETVERVLKVIQGFDPPGVGARNLAECLRIQLENRGERNPAILDMINNHFEQLMKRKFKEIAKQTKLDEKTVHEIFQSIAHLEPKPGRARSSEQPMYIQPDVTVKKVDEGYMIYLNEGRLGNLRVSGYYRDMVRNFGDLKQEDRNFVQDKYRSAMWLIRNIERRKSTILKVTEAIMSVQKGFLEKGIEALRPLTLKDIADIVGMHESTVARVTTGKYVETPRGTFELKYFFSPRLETDDGEDTSATSIKEKIAKLVDGEDKQHPLSDQRIAEILRQEGIDIARRTVAKYREGLKILSAKMRKEYQEDSQGS